MALVPSNLQYDNVGSEKKVIGTLAFDSSYPTGGEALAASSLGLAQIRRLKLQPEQGYEFSVAYTTPFSVNVLAYVSAGATPAGTISAPTFTGTAPVSDLNLATPAFSGTGLTAAGQVITTTSTHTMTLNQCAGMWLIPATGATPVMLILSNTAVTGAAAVLTVQGSASTDAGAYKIVKSLTPVGTNSAPTFTGTAIAAGVATQVANATDLSALTAVEFEAYGY